MEKFYKVLDLVHWLGPVIFEAEYRGEMLAHHNKIVVREARITRQLMKWNDRTARLFAADCAEKVLPIFEEAYPEDKRPRQAIDKARLFADGKATDIERAAARAAAGDAAGAWQTERLFWYLEGEKGSIQEMK